MKNKKTYIPCVLITIIFVFSLLGTGICLIADNIILNPQTCINIAEEKQLASKIKVLIDKDFKEKYNATGIPAEVYTDIITEEWIDTAVKSIITEGFDYLNNSSDYTQKSVLFELDFELLDKNISDFFSNYADENGYEKDESYENKLKSEIFASHRVIESYVDTFKMNTLYNEGILSQAGRYIKYLDTLTYLCIGLLIFSFVLIILLCIKHIKESLYWTGCAFTISGIIGLIPCIYLNTSNYFDAFVIKQEQIFISFTSFMYKIVDYVETLEIMMLSLGIVMIIGYVIIRMIDKPEK